MTTISNKSELVKHLEDPIFAALLAANSEADLSKIDISPEDCVEYQANPLDEDDESVDGVYLFSTPLKSNGSGVNYGTTVRVIKIFGESDYPFRLEASEDVPWGNGMELDELLGDFRTLEEAVDLAFHIHEKGTIQLNTLLENEESGGYSNGPSKIDIPALPSRQEKSEFSI